MNTYGQYHRAYQKASVNTMDQQKLIVMLYDGAIKYISIAVERLQHRELEKAHANLIKAKSIVSELMASLNLEQGGDIAKNLQSLYNYMFGLLIDANVQKNPEPARIVLKLLKELREAWAVIGNAGKQQPDPAQIGTGPNRTAKTISLKG
ncbi:MAG: flagellar export chaperone FliS [SAR324 cluster bacterium]|nr:flagellar export chaperone FliS [SAR324 cluster bacterium]